MKYFLSLLLALFASSTQASELNLRLGVGAGNDFNFGTVKYAELGYSGSIVGPLVYTLATGAIIDSRASYASTPFLAAEGGLKALYGGLMASLQGGLAAIAFPDPALSSYYQFTLSAQVGICDNDGHCVSAFYRHFSNAGLRGTNLGRDFLGAGAVIAF
jgi:hypothetical protein